MKLVKLRYKIGAPHWSHFNYSYGYKNRRIRDCTATQIIICTMRILLKGDALGETEMKIESPINQTLATQMPCPKTFIT